MIYELTGDKKYKSLLRNYKNPQRIKIWSFKEASKLSLKKYRNDLLSGIEDNLSCNIPWNNEIQLEYKINNIDFIENDYPNDPVDDLPF